MIKHYTYGEMEELTKDSLLLIGLMDVINDLIDRINELEKEKQSD